MTDNTRPLALISGGSAGIGLELARQFAAHGFDLAISGSSEKVFSAAETLRAEYPVEIYPHRADASTFAGVESFWRHVEALRRPVDAAALNVGVGLGGAFSDNSLEDELRVIAVNITGTVHLAKRVVQHMVPRGQGRILIVSSISATSPTPFETVYGPSKAFGFSFAEGLREELRGTGVTVSALLPGATDSEFHSNAGMDNTKLGPGAKKNDKRLVAKQGFDALMNDVDHVVGGDAETQQIVVDNRTTPETVKAARQAELTRPQN
ncbi:SDR family NAD(P)-dependent oxidoreductase [Microbacterium sp. GXF0217]